MQVEKQVYIKLQQGVRYEPLARRPKKEGKEFHFCLFGPEGLGRGYEVEEVIPKLKLGFPFSFVLVICTCKSFFYLFIPLIGHEGIKHAL